MQLTSITVRRLSKVILVGTTFLLVIHALVSPVSPGSERIDFNAMLLFQEAKNQTLCSQRSAKRGTDQHVLSVSAYESDDRIELKTSQTWDYIKTFVQEAKIFYPTWVVRVYHYDLRDKTPEDFRNLEALHDNLDFCNVEQLPVLGNMKHRLPGKMQRFLPAIDPTVSVFNVRDLDSAIFQREVSAVNEWLLNSTYAFHIMRDHEQHGIPILGGLWGLASNRLSILDRIKIAHALHPPKDPEGLKRFLEKYSRAGDQSFLSDHLWPLARKNSLAHDSYHCIWSKYIYRSDTRPFLTKREHPSCFVGCPKPCCTEESKKITDLSKYQKCPASCRPNEHKDWLFC